MAVTTSYEVYQKRDNDWIARCAHTNRDETLGRARRIIEQKPSTAVHVVDERLGSGTNELHATVIFDGGQADRHPGHTQGRPLLRQPPTKQEHPVCVFISSAIIIVLSICGIGTAALIGVAILVDIIK